MEKDRETGQGQDGDRLLTARLTREEAAVIEAARAAAPGEREDRCREARELAAELFRRVEEGPARRGAGAGDDAHAHARE